MKAESKHIRIGLFEGFKGEDSILISADICGLRELEDVFLRLSNGAGSYDFSALSLLDVKYRIELVALNEESNVGLKRAADGKYEWRLSNEKWGEFREKIVALYGLGVSGHQYLDSDSNANDDFQVVCSWNEYSEDFWMQYSLGPND